MLTYALENRGTDTLYEYLYKQIKTDILSKKLVAGERLPSKRLLAKNLNVSTITVENAYSQLVAEGYIYSIPKSGYYVTDISADLMKPLPERPAKQFEKPKEKKTYFADFASNSTVEDAFPFSIWSKLLKEVMAENSKELMSRSPSKGVYELRSAVAGYLYQFRGMDVKPEQVIIGAGTEYLYGLIIQLLGYDKCYAVEDPGYQKISRIYQAQNVCCKFVAMDENGINMEALEESGADVLHISPAHHFPTGLVTPVSRDMNCYLGHPERTTAISSKMNMTVNFDWLASRYLHLKVSMWAKRSSISTHFPRAFPLRSVSVIWFFRRV